MPITLPESADVRFVEVDSDLVIAIIRRPPATPANAGKIAAAVADAVDEARAAGTKARTCCGSHGPRHMKGCRKAVQQVRPGRPAKGGACQDCGGKNYMHRAGCSKKRPKIATSKNEKIAAVCVDCDKEVMVYPDIDWNTTVCQDCAGKLIQKPD